MLKAALFCPMPVGTNETRTVQLCEGESVLPEQSLDVTTKSGLSVPVIAVFSIVTLIIPVLEIENVQGEELLVLTTEPKS